MPRIKRVRTGGVSSQIGVLMFDARPKKAPQIDPKHLLIGVGLFALAEIIIQLLLL